MAMLVSLLLGFQLLGDEGMSPLVSALLLGSIVMLGIFVFAEKRAKDPVIMMHLFKIHYLLWSTWLQHWLVVFDGNRCLYPYVDARCIRAECSNWWAGISTIITSLDGRFFPCKQVDDSNENSLGLENWTTNRSYWGRLVVSYAFQK